MVRSAAVTKALPQVLHAAGPRRTRLADPLRTVPSRWGAGAAPSPSRNRLTLRTARPPGSRAAAQLKCNSSLARVTPT